MTRSSRILHIPTCLYCASGNHLNQKNQQRKKILLNGFNSFSMRAAIKFQLTFSDPIFKYAFHSIYEN